MHKWRHAWSEKRRIRGAAQLPGFIRQDHDLQLINMLSSVHCVRKSILDENAMGTRFTPARPCPPPPTVLGLGHLFEEFAEGGAQVFGVAEMRAHAGAEFGLVDEFVGVRAVLERRLRPEQKRIDVGRANRAAAVRASGRAGRPAARHAARAAPRAAGRSRPGSAACSGGRCGGG